MARDYTINRIGSGLNVTVGKKQFHIDKDGEVARQDGNATTKTDVTTIVDVLGHSRQNNWIAQVNQWATRSNL